jgi:hypothetical protein
VCGKYLGASFRSSRLDLDVADVVAVAGNVLGMFGILSVVSKHGRPSLIVSVLGEFKTKPVAYSNAHDWSAYP